MLQKTKKMTETNLRNSGNSIRKTREVLKYINNLEPLQKWEKQQNMAFDRVIKEAKNENTAEKMLDKIGYRYKKRPIIYDKIEGVNEDDNKEHN